MTTMVTNHQWKWQHFHGFQHLSKQNAQQYVYVWIAWLNKFSYSIVIEHIETIVPLKKFRFHLGYDWVLGVLRKTFSLLHTAASLFFVIIRSSTNLFIQFILKIKKAPFNDENETCFVILCFHIRARDTIWCVLYTVYAFPSEITWVKLLNFKIDLF